MNCQTSQTSGNAINHRGAADFQRATGYPRHGDHLPAAHTPRRSARDNRAGTPKTPSGAVTHFSSDGRVAELQQRQPQHRAEQPRKNGRPQLIPARSCALAVQVHGRVWLPPHRVGGTLQPQFQQPDLQGQGFLDVCVQPALKLLHDPQILHGLLRRDPLGHALRPGHLRKSQKPLQRGDSR